MPLYEITLEQSYFGQQCINRWNYQSDAIAAGTSGAYLAIVGMGAIADDDTPAFDLTTILGQIQGLQTTDAVFVQMVAKNLYSNTDFFTYAFPPNTHGANNTGESLSPAMAFGFTSDRTRADIRRAQKRFVGVGENYVGSGGNIPADKLAALQILGDHMAAPNSVTLGGVTNVFTPYIFGREKYHPAGKTTWAYKYYPTEAEQLAHIAKINAFTVKPNVRTQTSRQYGRGS